MNQQTTLLVDADVPLYKAAFASEVETDWGNDVWTLHGNMAQAKEIFNQEIDDIRAAFPPDSHVVLCLSDSSNFRKGLMSTYKDNRKNVRKPLLLKALRAWVDDMDEAVCSPTLEADDILGLLSHLPGHIMVSIDKDLKTVPGQHYNPSFPDDGVYTVTPDEAHYNHMYQTLCGDSTDGYKGCPGVGPVAAAKLLDVPVDNMWAAVQLAFSKKGINRCDALVQARLARILRGDEHDFMGNLNLWSPDSE
jgi:DNA polymerase-1